MNLTDVKQFHSDLKAAIIARAPIEIGETSGAGGKLTLTRLSDLENSIQSRFAIEGSSGVDSDRADEPTSLNQVIASEPGLPDRYRAALHTFDQIGWMVPVLDGLSARRVAQRQVSRVMRRAFVYMIFLLLVASCGLWLFKSSIVPRVDSLRADIALSAGVAAPERFSESPVLTALMTVLGCGLVLFVVWMLFGGALKLAMWLGGSQYVQCRTSTTAIRTLQLLLGAGLPVDDAVAVSCDLTGADNKLRHNIQFAARYPQNTLHFKSLSDYLTVSANQRLNNMKVAAPTALICSVGGIVALVYCVVIFWPIITILRDLTTVGI